MATEAELCSEHAKVMGSAMRELGVVFEKTAAAAEARWKRTGFDPVFSTVYAIAKVARLKGFAGGCPICYLNERCKCGNPDCCANFVFESVRTICYQAALLLGIDATVPVANTVADKTIN